MKPRAPRKPRDRGAALILVLWGAVIMSVIAAAAARQATTSAVVVNAGSELTRARALADAGVRTGWSAFADGRFSTLETSWGCRNGGDLLIVQLKPEASRVDVNVASEKMLAAVFEAAGVAQPRAKQIAASVVAYRGVGEGEPDASPIDPLFAQEPERPPAGTFIRGQMQAIEELGYVPGIDTALYRAIADDVTVLGRSDQVDVRYASPLVRRALDLLARADGLPSEQADTSDGIPSFEGELMDVRAIAVTASGAVFVRQAVVEGPFDQDGAPTIKRLVQGNLRAGETLPDGQAAPSCAEGFAALGRT